MGTVGSDDTSFSACDGDWTPFLDKKCYKIVDEVVTYKEAEGLCTKQGKGSNVLTIGSQEEQDFLVKYLFSTNQVIDSVWLWGQRSGNSSGNPSFLWNNGEDMAFNSWAEGSPSRLKYAKCMQMRFLFSSMSMSIDSNEEGPDFEGPTNGEWTDIPCRKRNLVVCERVQNWTVTRIQETLMNTIRKLRDVESRVQTQVPVPVGFIYIQINGQQSPNQLWSSFEWEDVSAEYGGLFFRVSGNGSAPFGTIQEGSAPRLVAVQKTASTGCTASCPVHADNEWSQNVAITGAYSENSYRSLQFKVSSDEVRPKNQAIRVWKRIS
jgi:hypothetical protein